MINQLPENIDPTKQKYINLFKYLKEFALLRDDVVRNIEQSSKYEFHVWLNEIPIYKGFECIIWDDIKDKETANWIQIKRPKEPELPLPTEELRPWVLVPNDLTDIFNTPTLIESIEIQNKKLEIINFPNITKEFNIFLEKWLEWTEKYKEYLNLMAVYNKFFNIHKQSKKFGDEYELIIGLGLLCFKVEGQSKSVIKRHCFVADASIDFDPEKGIFTVNEGKEGAKLRLETEMLKDLLEYDVVLQKEIEQKLQEYSEAPFSSDLKNTLKMWAQSLHFNGNYIDKLDHEITISTKPIITYSPALILRKRNTKSLSNSFSNIIDFILNNMPDKLGLIDDLTETNTSEDKSDRTSYEDTSSNTNDSIKDDIIYFPKPANDQQIEIVQRLNKHKKVLVQGPPGTGKTHTIANLICHLLATNKKVLITAQTKRALNVIKEKLPEEIQPLCINLLGNDQDSIEDLEASVKEINNRLTYFDKSKTNQEIKWLENKLKEKKTLLSENKNKIISIREKDTKKHHITEKYQGTLLEIAYKISKDDQLYNWFSDSISQIETTFNPENNYILLLEHKNSIKNFDENILEQKLPDKNTLITIEAFKELIDNQKLLNNKIASLNNNLIQKNECFDLLNCKQKNEIKNILIDLINEINKLKKFKLSWSEHAINECMHGYNSTWKQLHELSSQSLNENFKTNISNFESDVKIQLNNDFPKQKIKTDALELRNYFLNGGKMKYMLLFTPKVIKEQAYLLDNVFINGNKCDNIQNLDILIQYIDIESEFEKLRKNWLSKINQEINGSYIIQFAEY
ncbi:MAG: AAA family ATPase [Bacteroidales bacterium]|nr:AAA family ATPase [Bacteroidales bacterium]